jgi:hypothetical protein
MNQHDRRVLQISSGKDARTRDKRSRPSVMLTKNHLRQVVQACLGQLDTLGKKLAAAGGTGVATRSLAKQYTSYLITLSFVMLLGPRQQVFQQLVIGESFIKSKDGVYSIMLKSHQTKNGKAVLLRVPPLLTAHYHVYLSVVRPLLVDPANDSGALFVQRNNTNRVDFTGITKAITNSILGFAVNSHAFRHALATSFYQTPGSNDKMMRDLASVMNHDPETQKNFYVHHQNLQSQEELQQTLSSILGIGQNGRSCTERTIAGVAAIDLPD